MYSYKQLTYRQGCACIARDLRSRHLAQRTWSGALHQDFTLVFGDKTRKRFVRIPLRGQQTSISPVSESHPCLGLSSRIFNPRSILSKGCDRSPSVNKIYIVRRTLLLLIGRQPLRCDTEDSPPPPPFTIIRRHALLCDGRPTRFYLFRGGHIGPG
ncbi:hypothetical protein DAEQUDRAFT_41919 [Daedalea quercina L-15889]|uniref:Uncharacterized protein n=1 Tax=Daedalea quercina L-15889 TaxID=1314783 RepID=A0A165LE78_9APHY|nr:hypothetical protein DAEQUDRAFT_41919 [Daedalea quercina L-15889]